MTLTFFKHIRLAYNAGYRAGAAGNIHFSRAIGRDINGKEVYQHYVPHNPFTGRSVLKAAAWETGRIEGLRRRVEILARRSAV